MSASTSPERIAANCTRLRKGTHVGALALAFLGVEARSLCAWCLMRLDPEERLAVARVGMGGECGACPYTGRDCLLTWRAEERT